MSTDSKKQVDFIEQLEFDGFTREQAIFGVEAVGY